MVLSEKLNMIFDSVTELYHKDDNIDAVLVNPYSEGTIENRLFTKNWIDAVQWHLEDIIRNPEIDPTEALLIKRRIDSSNQERTDLVEMIDSYFLELFANVNIKSEATINSESPAWAIDRLSILALKLYHMRAEVEREDADPQHIEECTKKLATLEEQRSDLSSAIDTLLTEMEQGEKYMKVYKQMKMYNDPSLNPVLYAKK